MNEFHSFCPLNVASQSLIVGRVLSGKLKNCNCFSALWRFLLIIFPESRRQEMDDEAWITILKNCRQAMSKKFKTPEEFQIKSFKNYNDIRGLIQDKYHKLSGKECILQLDSILRILWFSSPPINNSEKVEEELKCAINIIVRLFHQFEIEFPQYNQENNPISILMNPKFICHDICLIMKSIHQYLEPFKLQKSHIRESYNQICFTINQLNEEMKKSPGKFALFHELTNEPNKNTFSNSPLKIFSKLHLSLPSFFLPNADNSSNNNNNNDNDNNNDNTTLSANPSNPVQSEQLVLPPIDDTIKILYLFNELFETITPEQEINHVWTFIFSQYIDQSIFPLFYSYIYLYSKKVTNSSKLPMSKICMQVGSRLKKFDEKQELIMASQRIDELINLLENDDSIKNREIVRNQIETILKIARGNAIIEELLPIKYISEYLDKILK